MKFLSFVSCKKNSKLTRAALSFYIGWYVLWTLSTCVLLAAAFYHFGTEYFSFRNIYTASFLLAKSVLYIFIFLSLINVFLRQSYVLSLSRISRFLFILFLIDLASLFSGSVSRPNVASEFLETLSKDGLFYKIYYPTYKYIPMVFDFLKPSINGISLLLMSVFLRQIAKMESFQNIDTSEVQDVLNQ